MHTSPTYFSFLEALVGITFCALVVFGIFNDEDGISVLQGVGGIVAVVVLLIGYGLYHHYTERKIDVNANKLNSVSFTMTVKPDGWYVPNVEIPPDKKINVGSPTPIIVKVNDVELYPAFDERGEYSMSFFTTSVPDINNHVDNENIVTVRKGERLLFKLSPDSQVYGASILVDVTDADTTSLVRKIETEKTNSTWSMLITIGVIFIVIAGFIFFGFLVLGKYGMYLKAQKEEARKQAELKEQEELKRKVAGINPDDILNMEVDD